MHAIPLSGIGFHSPDLKPAQAETERIKVIKYVSEIYKTAEGTDRGSVAHCPAQNELKGAPWAQNKMHVYSIRIGASRFFYTLLAV